MRIIYYIAFSPNGNRLLFVGDVDDRLGEDGITLHSVEEGTKLTEGRSAICRGIELQ